MNNALQYVHYDWETILSIANNNPNELLLPENIKGIDFIIKVNTKIAESVGYMYAAYLSANFC